MRIGALLTVLALLSVAPVAGASAASGDAAPDLAEPAREPSLSGDPSVACTLASMATTPDPVPAALGDVTAQSCTVEVDCPSGPISCEGGVCNGQERACSVGERGYVECDGDRTYCPDSCCPCGSCGATRLVDTGSCCSNNLRLQEIQECTTSGWQDTGETTCIQECDDGGGL